MSRAEELKRVIAQKQEIIKLKKYNIKHSLECVVEPAIIKPEQLTEKGILPKDKEDVIYRKIVANTYNWMDSHSDVHVKGIFNKSIKEVKPFLLHDHKFETTAKIGEIISSTEKQVMWEDLGLPKTGSTYALVHNVAIEKARNAVIFDDYKNGRINQHSVGMQYVKIDLAVDDREEEEAFKLYNKVLPMLGNSDLAEKQGYFFVVSEAKLRETSAVLMGSNVLTGVLDDNTRKSIDKIEQLKELIKTIDDIEKVYNICKEFDTCNDEPLDNTQKNKPSYFELISKF
jgi:hypothetical protein